MTTKSGNVDWATLTIIAGVALTATVGAIWVGGLSTQVSINTKRLDQLEDFANQVRTHNANTNATTHDLDRRLDKLENNVERHLETTAPTPR